MTRKVFCSLLCSLVLLFSCVSAADAADLSNQNLRRISMNWGAVLELKTNEYTEDKPLIVFLPGVAECTRIAEAARWMRNYHLYDDMEADVVTAAFWPLWGQNEQGDDITPPGIDYWDYLMDELFAFLKEKYDASPFAVYVDSVSYSGYGACSLVQKLLDAGISVRELTLADGCLPGWVTEEWLAEFAAAGVQVNIFANSEKGDVYEETRRIIEALEGTENINGQVLEVWHGELLRSAIADHGLHADFLIPEE